MVGLQEILRRRKQFHTDTVYSRRVELLNWGCSQTVKGKL